MGTTTSEFYNDSQGTALNSDHDEASHTEDEDRFDDLDGIAEAPGDDVPGTLLPPHPLLFQQQQ
jgi:hypothetical protein